MVALALGDLEANVSDATLDIDALYASYYDEAVRFAVLLTGGRQLAEDVVHDAFVRLFARPRQLRDPSAARTYLRRTVMNVAFSRHRSHRREQARVERLVPPSSTVEVRDEPELWTALQRLPERQRAAVVLRYWLDATEAEMARMLRCRPGTVKSLLSRALAALRTDLESIDV